MTCHGRAESGARIGTMLSSSARFESNAQFLECYVLRRKIWKALYDDPHTIRGISTLKDV